MPGRLSKFTVETESCQIFTHPWTDSCISAQVGLGLHAFQESLRIYSTVYFITLLMRGKKPSKNDVIKTVLGILQSTAFLSWSAMTYPVFICLFRKVLGNFNILTVSFLPSFLSSLSAIPIERSSRRPMLCLYVANIATETLFRMAVWRGYIKPIPYGNVYIFAAGMATLLYLLRSRSSKDSIFKIIKFIVGPYEDPEYVDNQIISDEYSNDRRGRPIINRSKSSFNIVRQSLRVYQTIIDWIKSYKKHISCPHPYSCAHFVLTGSAKLFGAGLLAQIGLKLALQFRKIFTKSGMRKDVIFNRANLNLAIFLGGFSGIYRLLSCSLRRVCETNSAFHAIPAGLMASVAFVMFPNNTIALYVMWKALQLLWNRGVEDKKLPEIKGFVIFFYCFCTAVLFHAAIIEPQNLRVSYWKFLSTLSGGRVAAMSRTPLDMFGLESSKHLQDILKMTNTSDKWPSF
ncbi:hypothetical protein PV328_003386 [Microctonus aethiopoides]|uniref:Transmembrane protein 135 N-terminal domain-containing protein n=1 Tax=Microctonus aethiopoides TaxID=144406 RepID=A0AA39F8B0_9HYME|nr:hypothetical protein PV328_003386 [Microctonus aethiopoides]